VKIRFLERRRRRRRRRAALQYIIMYAHLARVCYYTAAAEDKYRH